MSKFIKVIFFLFSILVISLCSIDDEADINEFTIQLGTECGWGASLASVAVKQGQIEYTPNIPCCEERQVEKERKTLNNEEWEDLISCFDYDYFLSLYITNCNICFDGCDEFIRITKDGKAHEIRYNPSESIEGLETLQETLREYLAEFYQID